MARLQEDKLHQMRLIPADVTFVPYMSILRNCRCWRSVRLGEGLSIMSSLRKVLLKDSVVHYVKITSSMVSYV